MLDLERHHDHIPLIQLWWFRASVERISFAEYVHIMTCERCRTALFACIRNETFESAEMDLTGGGVRGRPN